MRNLVLAVTVMFSLLLAGCAEKTHVAGDVPPAVPPVVAETAGPPAVEVPESSYNFGEVVEGSTYLHQFVIRNRGTGMLEITGVRPGCGTHLEGFDRFIPPGGEGKISLRLYGRGCQSGQKKVSVVTCNDPRWPRFTLVVVGKLR